MALELGNVVGKVGGGGVILDRDVEITAGNAWVEVAEFEITTTSHIAVTITHASNADTWTTQAPTVVISPADGRSPVPGVNRTRAQGSSASGEAQYPLNTAGLMEPGKYKANAHSQRSGRNVGLTHVTVTAVPI